MTGHGHGHGLRPPKGSRRPWLIAGLTTAVVVTSFLCLPHPAPRLREVVISDDQLRAMVSASRLPPTTVHAITSPADLGRELFRAEGLSSRPGRTCSTCHTEGRSNDHARPDQDRTSGSSMAAVPRLTHLDLGGWYGNDGRSDSLAAACLAALEEAQVMGGSRLGVLAQVQLHFRPLYEQAFGAWPTQLIGLAGSGRPAGTELKLPINIAAQGLATLGFYPLLNEILEQGRLEHTTPAVEFSRRAFAANPVPPAWVSAFAALSPEQQAATNQAYARVGQALAAYLAGLTGDDSPYDRFAARLLQGRSPSDALGEGFGASELIGLKLFTGPGQCAHCHSGPRFSDGMFHNIGLPQHGTAIAAGRAAGLQVALADPFNCKGAFLAQAAANATPACKELQTTTASVGQVSDLGAFKTPSLRNVARSSYYMHDGRFTSLTEVMRFFNAANATPAIGIRDALVQPLGFTTEEMEAVVAFLGSLSAPVRDLN